MNIRPTHCCPRSYNQHSYTAAAHPGACSCGGHLPPFRSGLSHPQQPGCPRQPGNFTRSNTYIPQQTSAFSYRPQVFHSVPQRASVPQFTRLVYPPQHRGFCPADTGTPPNPRLPFCQRAPHTVTQVPTQTPSPGQAQDKDNDSDGPLTAPPYPGASVPPFAVRPPVPQVNPGLFYPGSSNPPIPRQPLYQHSNFTVPMSSHPVLQLWKQVPSQGEESGQAKDQNSCSTLPAQISTEPGSASVSVPLPMTEIAEDSQPLGFTHTDSPQVPQVPQEQSHSLDSLHDPLVAWEDPTVPEMGNTMHESDRSGDSDSSVEVISIAEMSARHSLSSIGDVRPMPTEPGAGYEGLASTQDEQLLVLAGDAYPAAATAVAAAAATEAATSLEEVEQPAEEDDVVFQEPFTLVDVPHQDTDDVQGGAAPENPPGKPTAEPWQNPAMTDCDATVLLQEAIASGNASFAADMATLLAERRCDIALLNAPRTPAPPVTDIRVELCTVDCQEPPAEVRWGVQPGTTVRQLKQKLHRDCNISPSSNNQRWVVGSCVIDDDDAPLSQFGITDENELPISAFLVSLVPLDLATLAPAEDGAEESGTMEADGLQDEAVHTVGGGARPKVRRLTETAEDYPDTRQDEFMAQQLAASFEQEAPEGVLNDLMTLEARDYIPNLDQIDCPICFDTIQPGDGVMLRECTHSLCIPCITDHIKHCDQATVKCPFVDGDYSCNCEMQHREIQSLVDEEIFNKHLKKGLSIAEGQAPNSFHCKTANCPGWCVYDGDTVFFFCETCGSRNCLNCKAIHEGKNCKQYQEDIKTKASNDKAAQATHTMMQDMLAKGEAMECPNCQVVLQRVDGCDWLKCSMCQTEICWVTRGRRWGPKGHGDSSGGCRCRVNGKKCHPACNNCH